MNTEVIAKMQSGSVFPWMVILAMFICFGNTSLQADDLGTGNLPKPDPSPARVRLKTPTIVMYGYNDAMRKQWSETLKTANVITGHTSDPKFVKTLRDKGVVFAWHVTNPPKAQTVAELVDAWSAPFANTLDGKLPGGFDAIAIDELRPVKDGSPQSKRVVAALRELRRRYPKRLIFVWSMWQLAAGNSLGRHSFKDSFDDLLRAARDYADQFWLECYIREANPQFHLFKDLARNISKRMPKLMKKTVFGLYISQTKPFIADDDKNVDFFEFLDAQCHLIRNDPLLSKTRGVAFWAFYRAKPKTITHVNALARHYFIKGRKKYYGSGKWRK